MIYVDTSVLLAELLAEDRHPSPGFWAGSLVSSRLAEYEVWIRLHARQLGTSHGEAARLLIGRLALVEMVSPVLTRALEPFPHPVRTLDGLHLAAVAFLRDRRVPVSIATYDTRLGAAAEAMGIPLAAIG